MRKIDTKHKDLLVVEARYIMHNFTIIHVYLSVSDYTLNDKIIKEIEKKITRNNFCKYIILSDLLGHVGLVGKQKKNTNGKRDTKTNRGTGSNYTELKP